MVGDSVVEIIVDEFVDVVLVGGLVVVVEAVVEVTVEEVMVIEVVVEMATISKKKRNNSKAYGLPSHILKIKLELRPP